MLGLLQIAPHDQRDDRECRADEEWNAPAPGADLVIGEKHLLQHEQHEQCADLTPDEGHVLEARIETAMAPIRHLGEIGRAGSVFAAEAQPLHDARDRKQDRRENADRLVGRRHGDHQRAEAHQCDGEHQRAASAVVVRQIAEHPAADRPHDEARRKQHRGVELLHHRIGIGEKGRREIKREGRVGVEIVPLDQIADRSDEDRLDAPPHVGEVEMFSVGSGSERGGGHGIPGVGAHYRTVNPAAPRRVPVMLMINRAAR